MVINDNSLFLSWLNTPVCHVMQNQRSTLSTHSGLRMIMPLSASSMFIRIFSLELFTILP